MGPPMREDTIFALGSGFGRTAIAVFRVSGPAAQAVLAGIAGDVPAPRRAALRLLRDPQSGEAIDRGLALFFPAPHSATGEDYVEFHTHGGRAVVEAMSAALGRQPDVRAAEPGEFVRRGFAAGKLDLSQAEALADLVDAQTDAQRRQALRLAEGALRRPAESWRAALVGALAMVEADLDFSDEGDVGAFSHSDFAALLAPVAMGIGDALQDNPASERLRDGFRVMILGRPNAGKSTLLNALAQRDIAIVSPLPGTTRDMIEAHLDLAGLPVTIVDTAGLREAQDEIERIGVDRVRARLADADLALWLSEDADWSGAPDHPELIGVATKTDLRPAPPGWRGVSAKDGSGLDDLLAEIAKRAQARMGDGGAAIIGRVRQRAALEAARQALTAARDGGKPLELVAEDLRAAAAALGRITGAVDVEEVLDAVFSRFCLGK